MNNEKNIPRLFAALALLTTALTSAQAQNPTLTIDANQPVRKVSSLHYGLMTEELNHSYDGGLYAELIHNRAFNDNAQTPVQGFRSLAPNANQILLAADPMATNSIDHPKKVVPITTRISGFQPTFTHTFAPHSITMLRLEVR